MLADKLMGSSSVDKLYVDDVFSTYLYTGNGTTQTINNGIDLAGQGGMVWIKSRSTSDGHRLHDTVRGAGSYLSSDTFAAQALETTGVSSFSASGFNLGSNVGYNGSGPNYVSWTFRKAPKFFDVVTYTGNGVAGRQMPHNLGIAPGMVIVKSLVTAGVWRVYHRSLGATKNIRLNETAAFETDGLIWNDTEPTSSVFTLGTNGNVNLNGETYVAYLFAHDPSADGIIQCGSFNTNADGSAVVNLGWEPQYLLFKNSGDVADWEIVDSMRGMVATLSSTSNPELATNNSSAEFAMGSQGRHIAPTATGFTARQTASSTYIYLAIRRPNKPPTSGTEVFASAVMTGNGVEGRHVPCGFAADAFMSSRITSAASHGFANRLAGVGGLWTDSSDAEYGYGGSAQFQLSGWDVSSGVRLKAGYGAGFDTNSSNQWYSQYFFRRAPGFMDIVCYTGTGADLAVPHSLGVTPDLILTKCRNASQEWRADVLGVNYRGSINGAGPLNSGIAISRDSTTIYLGSVNALHNTAGRSYVTYLFGTLPGISKVGVYTGNGSSQTINCGFTTGARFILIKRVDATGDWYVWDSARGIVAANDPHLSLNTAAAEVTTDDSVDPDASGFIVNQNAATNINVSGGTYIFLAIS